MDPFNQQSPCPKCGSDRTSFRYCPGDETTAVGYEPPRSLVNGQQQAPRPPICTLGTDQAPLGKEHMHRWCANCQYEWAEATLDA